MNIDTLKIELIDWIAQLNDHQIINKLLSLKNKMSTQESKQDSKIYGSGKYLIDYGPRISMIPLMYSISIKIELPD